MSGLIWQAVGKSISDAGAMYGKYQMSQAEDQQREARELAREELAEALKEAAAMKDAEIYDKAEAAAPGIGEERRFAKFKADLGQTDMAEEDVRKVFDSQYNQRKTGDFEGADRYVERYSKQKEDVLNEIRRLGGSSGLINSARDSQKSALEAEKAADRLAFDEKREERRAEEARRTAENNERKTDAMFARITSGGSKKDDTNDQITRAENALSMARTRIEKSFREPTTQEKFNPALMSAYQEERNKFVENHPDIKRQTKRVEELYGGGSSAPAPARPAPAQTSGTRPPLSQFRQP
jgi:hypothetical protein